jgi:hypothetical protein
MTKKVKKPQEAVMKHLENHPEIVYIDGALANLRASEAIPLLIATTCLKTRLIAVL